MNLGVGLEHKIMRRVDFRVEARDHIVGTPTFGLPNAYSDAIFPVKGKANDVEYTAGFVVQIGKKK
jgi:hypothetical protein